MTRRKVLRFELPRPGQDYLSYYYAKGRYGWFIAVEGGDWVAIHWSPFNIAIEVTKLNRLLFNIPTHYKG